MASQVFSGTAQPSFTYTNNTGQNVRIVINYLKVESPSGTTTRTVNLSAGNLNLTYGGGTTFPNFTVGRNLAFYNSKENTSATGVAVAVAGNNAYGNTAGGPNNNYVDGFPTELMLSSGQVFSLTNSRFSYNIVVIPEAG
jgi:hypothetical protein